MTTPQAIARTCGLVALWVLLWGDLSLANVVTGLALVLALVLVFPPPRSWPHRIHPLAFLRYAGYLLVSLVRSSWGVVVAVVAPTPSRVAPHIVDVRLATRSPLVASIVSNSITLTPGTMTVELDPGTFVIRVHVLGPVDADPFRQQVLHLERLVAGAFTPEPVGRRSRTPEVGP